MRKKIIFVGLTALFLSGCNSSSGTDSSFEKFTKIVTNLSSYSSEVDEWDNYGAKMKKEGIIHEPANLADKKFVKNKMDSEYVAAVNHVGSAFTLTDESKKELAKENQGYKFTYNEILTVKNKNKNNTIGYCVNYDTERSIDGQIKSEDKDKKNFLYIDKIKPLSILTGGSDFIKLMCGDDFYNRNKGIDAD